MSTILTVRADGRVTPQGSKNKGRGGRSYEASRHLKLWRNTVIEETREAVVRNPDFDTTAGAYIVAVFFLVQRPKRHHVACDRARPLREGAPRYCASTPDVDKAARAVLDALTQGGAIPDDRRVVRLVAEKIYVGAHQQPGAAITVNPIPDGRL